MYINPDPTNVAGRLIFEDKAKNTVNGLGSVPVTLPSNMPWPNAKYSRNVLKKIRPSRCKYPATKDSINNIAATGNIAHKKGALLANIDVNINHAKIGNIHNA